MGANFTPAFGTYSPLTPFRYWCQKVLPLVYDDSLSYYECLNKTVDYLNKTMEDVETLHGDTEAMLAAFNQLQTYVNTYFDELDLTAEVQTVLDRMAENGSLDELLRPLVGEQIGGVVAEQIDDAVAGQIYNTVASQINGAIEQLLPGAIADSVSTWLDTHVDPETGYVIDKSLTISNAAADAEIVGNRLNGLDDILLDSEAYDISEIAEIAFTINSSNKWQAIQTVSRSSIIPLDENKRGIKITGNSNVNTVIAFLKDNTQPVDNTTPNFSDNYPERIIVDVDETKIYNIEADMKYMYVLRINTSSQNTEPTINYLHGKTDTTLTESNIAADAKIVGEEIDELNDHVTGLTDLIAEKRRYDFSDSDLMAMQISSQNVWNAITGQTRSTVIKTPVDNGEIRVEAQDGTNAVIAFLKNNNTPVSGQVPDFSDSYPARIVLDANTYRTFLIEEDMNYMYVLMIDTSGTDKEPNILYNSVKTDTTLTVNDMAADAGATGRAIRPLYTEQKDLDAFYFRWKYGYFINENGNEQANVRIAHTSKINVREGNVITNKSSATDSDNKTFAFTVNSFNDGTFVERKTIAPNSTYVVPSNVNNVIINFGYHSGAIDPPNMSPAILEAYFKINIIGELQPFAIFSDGEHPVYCAFGASTTEGLRYTTAGDRRFSIDNYPAIVAQNLNLKCFNYGVSGTGFMSRKDNANNNIMDMILTNTDTLARAKLITLHFGYGNDFMVGPSGSQVEFPIGHYYDYYPFDESGYNYDGDAGCVTMIEHGATFMGCLNWCIKYISQNFPYAQLVIIFGSPSSNYNRTITEIAQTPAPGTAPIRLSFAEPYLNPTEHTADYGIKSIKEEIDILKTKLNIPVIDLYFEGNMINWWNTYSLKPGATTYALFSTVRNEWNSHPNDDGYSKYGKFIAGKIVSQYKH